MRIGIDLGGTKIQASCSTAAAPKRVRSASYADAAYEDTVQACGPGGRASTEPARALCTVGSIGHPGAISRRPN